MGRGPTRPMGMPFRPPFGPGRGGGRGAQGEQQQKRRRTDRSGGVTKQGGGGKGRQNLPAAAYDEGAQVETTGGVQRQQMPGSGGPQDEVESESEDEAPRRSRHGQPKKRRREFENEEGGMNGEQMWEQHGSVQWDSPSVGREEPDDAGF